MNSATDSQLHLKGAIIVWMMWIKDSMDNRQLQKLQHPTATTTVAMSEREWRIFCVNIKNAMMWKWKEEGKKLMEILKADDELFSSSLVE